MRLDQANELLTPGYLPFETGYMRLDDGQSLVAYRTNMPKCTGQMVEWWYGHYLTNTEQYKWWHPRVHVWCAREGSRSNGNYIGGSHLVHEYIGPTLIKLKMNYHAPSEVLNIERLHDAGISAVIYIRLGLLDEPIWLGHMLHVCRDTDYGCEIRSRIWSGDVEPLELAPDRESRIQTFSNESAQWTLKHTQEEMSFLSRFLPTLYAKETGYSAA